MMTTETKLPFEKEYIQLFFNEIMNQAWLDRASSSSVC